ncbi:VOC family protein [Streptomyces sp. Li-HN-5-11]|uniref:VOC family protein n=1 Tax=Streptomyces sp. Li-HN-5-11 TaxID=3075432 RepID=UPI0028AE2839|nr:VOC family protein [Streptomyces sp. Li-HN-5-11]WNM34752.1 VOC family protein [Streptomyces sp. Li-HN-5-11]
MSKVSALGYLVVRGPTGSWREFGTGVLGAQLVEDTEPGRVRLRTDDRAWRIEVHEGPPGPDALIAIGYETATEEDLVEVIRGLKAKGVEVTEEAGLAASRGVRRAIAFRDPDGNRIEVFVSAGLTSAPFVSPRGIDFVSGDLGLGHVFMLSKDAAAAARFAQDTLGFKLTDTIAFGSDNAYFLHCNPRHHSLGFAPTPGPPPGVHHLMIEVDSLEAVGRALDLVHERGHQVTMSLGEHSNDRMTSFYVATPSGFSIEYGWNGRLVDDTHWKVTHYDSPSTWGHRRDGTAHAGNTTSSADAKKVTA